LEQTTVVDARKSQGEYVTVVNQTVLVYYFALTRSNTPPIVPYEWLSLC